MKYLFFPIFSRLGVYQIGLTLALCAISGSACSDRRNDPEPTFLGGQTGDEGGSQYARRAGTATKTCDFEESVFDRTATTIYGTSIDELMARFQTIESVPFHWQNYSWGDSVQVSSAGVTSLQLWPDIDKGTVYEIRLKPLDGSDGHRHCDAVWYEVPVQMHWSTADGALHEVQRSQTIDRSSLEVRPEGRRRDPPPTFTPPVVLTVLSPNVAHFQHRFELSTLNGSLALTSDEVRWDPPLSMRMLGSIEGAATGGSNCSLRVFGVWVMFPLFPMAPVAVRLSRATRGLPRCPQQRDRLQTHNPSFPIAPGMSEYGPAPLPATMPCRRCPPPQS